MEVRNIHGIPFEKRVDDNYGTLLSYDKCFFRLRLIIANELDRFICELRIGDTKVLQVEPFDSNTHITNFSCILTSNKIDDAIYAVLSTVNDYGIAELKELQNTFLTNYHKAKEVEAEEAALGKVATLEEVTSITYPLELYD